MGDFEKTYYESEEFWGEGGIGVPGKKRILRTVELLPDGIKKLLDAGCGNGIFCNLLQEAKSGFEILGMDRSQAALKHVKTEKIIGDINNIPFPDDSFDCVTCLQVLEHLPVNIYPKALEELARVSSQYIIISVPFQEDLTININQCPSCKSIFNWDLHLRSFDKNKINDLFEPFGFECTHQETLFKEMRYLGLDNYIKFRKSKHLKFSSPICPICGYTKPKNKPSAEAESGKNSKPGSKKMLKKLFTSALGPLWPKKEFPGYWIIGVYRKK